MTSTPTITACSPVVTRNLIDASVESWRVFAGGLTDYWAGALSSGATPLDLARDLARWWEETARRRPAPSWSTPNEIVQRSDIAFLRDFSGGSRARVLPTLVLPPQAGHASNIVDYGEGQSQITTIRDAGLERVWSMDWLPATQATKEATIDDYLELLERAVAGIGPPVNLIGDCQGGWLAAIYAALHPDDINTLTLAGAPIDFHAGHSVIHGWVRLVDLTGDLAYFRNLVALGNGVLKGELLLSGFIAIKPENEIDKQLQLLTKLDDPQHLKRHRAFEDWFKHTQDIAGAFYLWIVEHLFRDNKLIRGELEIRGARVDLGNIRAPLNLLAGATDHITPPPQVFAAAAAVASPGALIAQRMTSGGHLGLFMGHEALRVQWPPLLAGVLERSRLRRRRSAAKHLRSGEGGRRR
jgi:poly(3-hydroxybutyrate) depolymerase